MDYAEKLQRCHEYVEALEEEKRKIQVFQRELPLCLELVTQAIDACKRELSGTTTEYMYGQSECSVQTSSDGITTRPPVLEEFMPIKRTISSSDNDSGDDGGNDENDDEEHHSHIKPNNKTIKNKDKDKSSTDHKKKSDWLRSVQLWNQSTDPPSKEDLPGKVTVSEVKRNGGAFQPFHKEKSAGTSNQTLTKTPSPVPASATSSTEETKATGVTGSGSGGSGKKEEKESNRKQRRCWSPELHRRFLHALQQLGGSHAATPKQIRELMKVDGLTNDEVKSHLQKYRLHTTTRRPSPSTIHNNNNPQAPQFVVVGGIWVPPADYATVAAGTTTTTGETAAGNGIYAPLASLPPTSLSLVQKTQHTESEGRDSHSEGGNRRSGRSNSPATSSSTHTTTNSPLF